MCALKLQWGHRLIDLASEQIRTFWMCWTGSEISKIPNLVHFFHATSDRPTGLPRKFQALLGAFGDPMYGIFDFRLHVRDIELESSYLPSQPNLPNPYVIY